MGLLGWPLDEDLLRDCWGAVLEVAVAGGEGVVDGRGERFWIGIGRGVVVPYHFDGWVEEGYVNESEKVRI